MLRFVLELLSHIESRISLHLTLYHANKLFGLAIPKARTAQLGFHIDHIDAMIEIVDLTGDAAIELQDLPRRAQNGGSGRKGFVRSSWNRSLPSNGGLRSYDHRGFTIRPGSDVELSTGQCMRIRKINRSRFGSICVKGLLFERTEQYGGCFTISDTELCMSLNTIKGSTRSATSCTLIKKPVEAVIRLCDIIVTNLPSVQSFGPELFVCRWKVTNYYENEDSMRKGKTSAVAGEHFWPEECDEQYRADREHLLMDWRDDLKKGGSAKHYLPGESEYLRSEQLAAGIGNRDVSVEDMLAARKHMRQQVVSEITLNPTGFSGAYGSDADEEEVTEQWSRFLGYGDDDDDDDDECEELMVAPQLLTAQLTGPVRPGSRQLPTPPGAASDVCTLSDDDSDWSDDTLVGSSSTIRSQATPRSKKRRCDGDRLPESSHARSSERHNRAKRARPSLVSLKQQRYSLGDAFCGAGGVSRGAVGAGLRVKWACDFNIEACRTYGSNFYKTAVYQYPMRTFLEIGEVILKVDILHLSPPCQFFSPAHTRPGPDDEMNLASMYCISQALQKCRPRIVTLEETSGLQDQNKHKQYFRSLVRQFTDNGYSVRWAIFRCCDWGIPQQRRRLFLIAAW